VMQEGETVSLEKFEDVGAEKGDKKTYFQLKHTIATKGTTVARMRDRDTDLWKTLSMWIDKIEEQGDEDAQRKWIAESEFVLLSNKSTEENTFFQKVKAYQEKGKWDELKKHIEDEAAKGATEDTAKVGEKKTKTIRDYTKHVNEFALLKEFLGKVDTRFKSNEEIISDIDNLLTYQQHFREANAKNLRRILYGKLSEKLKGAALEYDLKSFDQEYGELFRKMRVRKFVATNKAVVVPERPLEQTFIKQLRDIDDFKTRAIDKVKELTEQKLRFENDYNNAVDVGGDEDRKNFEQDVKTRWDNYFGENNDGINVLSSIDDIQKAAQQVLKGVRGENLIFDEDNLNRDQSNGCFYHFSDGDRPKIGWRYDWKEKYNGEEWTIE